MQRVMRAFGAAAILIALLPGAASADPAERFQDHRVGVFCEGSTDPGYAFAGATASSEFGNVSEAAIWEGDADPFEDPATLNGLGDDVDVVETTDSLAFVATVPLMDADGSPSGEAVLTASLAATGASDTFEEPGFGNHRSRTTITSHYFEGPGTLTYPGGSVDFEVCFGDVTDTDAFFTNPRSFVSRTTGMDLFCTWQTDDVFASFWVFTSGDGAFADAFLATADAEYFAVGSSSAAIDPSGAQATVELEDAATGDAHTAVAEATFVPIGTPVRSVLRGSNLRIKLIELLYEATGTVEFSTGHTFAIDAESCVAVEYDRRSVNTQPRGPKPLGRVAVNDTPDGAITLRPGQRLITNNRGTALAPEAPILTCPEGEFDDFGRTLWYAIVGNGRAITIDTAGSRVDTLIGAYVMDGEDLVEVGCIDDVFRDPIGSSYQAALTLDTELGVTYLIQVGGFRDLIFGDGSAEIGQIRVRVR